MSDRDRNGDEAPDTPRTPPEAAAHTPGAALEERLGMLEGLVSNIAAELKRGFAAGSSDRRELRAMQENHERRENQQFGDMYAQVLLITADAEDWRRSRRELVSALAIQGKLVGKIAMSLGIAIDKSEPPPKFRAQLDSQRDELENLRGVDAETSQQIKAVTEDIAQTKLVIRVGLIEGIPKLVKVGSAIAAALGVLALLASQIWAVVHGK